MAKFKADFTGVGDGPGSKIPDGDYICKVSKITVEDGDKGKYLKWVLAIGLGEMKGKTIDHKTSLTPQSLFNLRNTIIACGIDVPKSAFNVDTDKYIGKIVGITVYQREYVKDNVKKTASDISELWRVAKTDKGYVRVGVPAVAPAAAAATIDEPQEEEDLTGGMIEEGIEEIEI